MKITFNIRHHTLNDTNEKPALSKAYAEAFGVVEATLRQHCEQSKFATTRVMVRAEDFSRFLILRAKYGAKNWFADLEAKEVNPAEPQPQPIDIDLTRPGNKLARPPAINAASWTGRPDEGIKLRPYQQRIVDALKSESVVKAWHILQGQYSTTGTDKSHIMDEILRVKEKEIHDRAANTEGTFGMGIGKTRIMEAEVADAVARGEKVLIVAPHPAAGVIRDSALEEVAVMFDKLAQKAQNKTMAYRGGPSVNRWAEQAVRRCEANAKIVRDMKGGVTADQARRERAIEYWSIRSGVLRLKVDGVWTALRFLDGVQPREVLKAENEHTYYYVRDERLDWTDVRKYGYL